MRSAVKPIPDSELGGQIAYTRADIFDEKEKLVATGLNWKLLTVRTEVEEG